MHAVIQIARLSDGSRKLVAVSEVTGMEGEVISMQDIFIFDRHGLDEAGKVRGAFRGVVYLLAVFFMMPLLLSLGFFDLWFDFRGKFRQS